MMSSLASLLDPAERRSEVMVYDQGWLTPYETSRGFIDGSVPVLQTWADSRGPYRAHNNSRWLSAAMKPSCS